MEDLEVMKVLRDVGGLVPSVFGPATNSLAKGFQPPPPQPQPTPEPAPQPVATKVVQPGAPPVVQRPGDPLKPQLDPQDFTYGAYMKQRAAEIASQRRDQMWNDAGTAAYRLGGTFTKSPSARAQLLGASPVSSGGGEGSGVSAQDFLGFADRAKAARLETQTEESLPGIAKLLNMDLAAVREMNKSNPQALAAALGKFTPQEIEAAKRAAAKSEADIALTKAQTGQTIAATGKTEQEIIAAKEDNQRAAELRKLVMDDSTPEAKERAQHLADSMGMTLEGLKAGLASGNLAATIGKLQQGTALYQDWLQTPLEYDKDGKPVMGPDGKPKHVQSWPEFIEADRQAKAVVPSPGNELLKQDMDRLSGMRKTADAAQQSLPNAVEMHTMIRDKRGLVGPILGAEGARNIAAYMASVGLLPPGLVQKVNDTQVLLNYAREAQREMAKTFGSQPTNYEDQLVGALAGKDLTQVRAALEELAVTRTRHAMAQSIAHQDEVRRLLTNEIYSKDPKVAAMLKSQLTKLPDYSEHMFAKNIREDLVKRRTDPEATDATRAQDIADFNNKYGAGMAEYLLRSKGLLKD